MPDPIDPVALETQRALDVLTHWTVATISIDFTQKGTGWPNGRPSFMTACNLVVEAGPQTLSGSNTRIPTCPVCRVEAYPNGC